jgi:hypothetical protein
MTDQGRYATVVQRVVDLTGVLRSRAGDAARVERNGTSAEQRARLETQIKRLERVVRDLEKAVA